MLTLPFFLDALGLLVKFTVPKKCRLFFSFPYVLSVVAVKPVKVEYKNDGGLFRDAA